MSSRSSPVARRLLVGHAIAVVSVLALLLLLETGSYLFGTFEGPATPFRGGRLVKMGQYDPLLFWTLRPGYADKDGLLILNSHGLRGPEIPPKARGEHRVLSLGESTTLAPRIAYEDCYSRVLERMLAEDDRGPVVRVINAGVAGYSLFQGYQYLKYRGLDLEPDTVLLYFGFNDYLPVSYLTEQLQGGRNRQSGITDWELFERRRSWTGRLTSFLAAHSNLYRASVHREGTATQVSEVRTDQDRPRVPAAHREELLGMTLALCRENDVALVVVIPWYLQFEEHIPLLRDFVERNDVPVVDLPSVLSALPRPRYFRDPMHPTTEAHRLIGEAIYEVLARLGL